jgi:hypothetical protein
MLRAIALSLVLLMGVGVIIPLTSDFVEAGPKKQRKYAAKKKKIKKYSKQWWRMYRARLKRKKAMIARKRALRLRQIRLARARRASNGETPNPRAVVQTPKTSKAPKVDDSPAILPNGDVAPKSWKKNQSSQSELQFRVDDENGSQLGSASIAVVGPSMGGDDNNPKAKTVGGVPTTSLRRNVIDQMIRENGWVVNDFQKEVGGRKVYVVVAQAEGKGGVQSRIFYFAEVDGRIYSVSTNSPSDSTERIAAESEKVLNMLVRRRQNPQQAGLNK